MSVETKRAVDEAIATHLADEMDGAHVAGYVLNVVGQTIDDALVDPEEGAMARGLWLVASGQLWPMSIGLVEELRMVLKRDRLDGLSDD